MSLNIYKQLIPYVSVIKLKSPELAAKGICPLGGLNGSLSLYSLLICHWMRSILGKGVAPQEWFCHFGSPWTISYPAPRSTSSLCRPPFISESSLSQTDPLDLSFPSPFLSALLRAEVCICVWEARQEILRQRMCWVAILNLRTLARRRDWKSPNEPPRWEEWWEKTPWDSAGAHPGRSWAPIMR